MRLLSDSAKWLFFAALGTAPWAYGGTTAISIVVINCLLGAALLFWLADLIVNRRLPKIPKGLLIIIGLLLTVGALMTINARAIYDSEFGTFASIANPLPFAAGSVDYTLSAAWMIRAALLLMSILFIVDLSHDDGALLQLWQAIAIAGGSIALLGLLQKATGAQAIFWQAPIEHYAETFFASYYYHANAGAYLNLVLPFSAGLAMRGFLTPSSQAARSLWLVIFLLNLAAIASNTSRGAQLVGGIILIGILFVLVPRMFRGLSRGEKNFALAGLAAIILVLYAIGQASHLEQPIAHWKQSEVISQDARWLATQAAIKAVPKVGLFGYGPGTFRAVFPALNAEANNLAGSGTWRFLHEDYLQTFIEWGWIGSALWAFLFFGGVAAAARSVQRQRRLRRRAAGKTEKLKTEILKSDDKLQISASQRFSVYAPASSAEMFPESGLSAERRPSAFSREWSWRRRVILPMSIIALSGVALHSLIDFPLQIESIQLYVATSLGLCWGSVAWKS
jgi:hypothetical protein